MMKKMLFALFLQAPLVLCHAQTHTASLTTAATPSVDSEEKEEDKGIVLFTPPTGWQLADRNLLPEHVSVMVVGRGSSAFPPSMNLSAEPYRGTLKQYLKIVKNMNEALNYEWKDLGTIRTEAGNASLSQRDIPSKWGMTRAMNVILVRNHQVYILTASALKDEFSIFYKDFFAAMRSLRVAKDAFDMVDNVQQRTSLRTAAQKLQTQWQTLLAQQQQKDPNLKENDLKEAVFNSEKFQISLWIPFKEMLKQKYQELGPDWQTIFLQKMEDDLFEAKL